MAPVTRGSSGYLQAKYGSDVTVPYTGSSVSAPPSAGLLKGPAENLRLLVYEELLDRICCRVDFHYVGWALNEICIDFSKPKGILYV